MSYNSIHTGAEIDDAISKVENGLPIPNGGTGADNAAGARTNLDIYSKSEVDSALSAKVAQTSLDSHTGNKSNPHSVTKSQVGLDNVPNVATNDQTPTYTEATTLDTLTSGEKLSVSFGKIKKAITDLISHIANKSNPHVVTKSQIGLENVDNTSDANKPISTATQTALDEIASRKADMTNGQYVVTTAGSGSAYTATVPSITALTAGVSFIMIPHVVSASTAPTLNVNGLGAKNIKRRLSNLSTSLQDGYSNTWLAASEPFRVVYDGTAWVVEGHEKPVAADIYGLTASVTELNYTEGVTSNIQEQLDGTVKTTGDQTVSANLTFTGDLLIEDTELETLWNELTGNTGNGSAK